MEIYSQRRDRHPAGSAHLRLGNPVDDIDSGVNFILDENLMTWPSSYFMKVYGKFWLAQTGFILSLRAFAEAAKETLVFLGCWQGLHLMLTWKGTDRRLIRWRAVLFLATVAYFVIFVPGYDVLRVIFFPKDMVLY